MDLSKYQADSTLIWAIQNLNLPKGAAWEFGDRQWQLELLDDSHKQIVVRKPTQVGLSTIMLTKMLHFADMNRVRATMTLPRQDDVYDMVNSRLSEIIANSPYIANKMGSIDNVRMKQFGTSWLHFVEMSVPPRMMDVDWMLNDEVDLSNSEHLEQAISRMDASKFGYHHRISTPTIHGYGIDALYELSDKKEWFVKCAYCSFEQILDWDLNVAHIRGETWYKCAHCGNKLHAQDIREGRWVVTGDSNAPISGYQINQLMCTYIEPSRLYVQYQTMTRKNFYNFRLGLPYTSSSGGFDREAIFERCFMSGHPEEERAMDEDAVYVLGADQGDTIHVSIGKLSEDGIKLVYFEEIPFELGFDRLAKLIYMFRVRIAVIDGLPNHHSAKKLVEEFPFIGYVAYFSSVDEMYRANEDEQKISISKTDAYDHLLLRIANSELQFYGLLPPDKKTNTVISHLANMRRDIEEQYTRAGGVKTFHVWKGIGKDHYADSLVYMLMAADMAEGYSQALSTYDIADYLNDPDKMDDPVMKQLLADVFTEENDAEPTLNRPNAGRPLTREEAGLVPDNPYAVREDFMERLFKR